MQTTNLYYLCPASDIISHNKDAKQIIKSDKFETEEGPATFFQLKNGDFQVSSMSHFRPIMLPLMKEELFLKLKELVPNQIKGKPAKIVRRGTGEEWDGFFTVSFTTNLLPYIDPNYFTEKDELICYANHVYVSESLALKLQSFIEDNYKNYCFTQHFPLFA